MPHARATLSGPVSPVFKRNAKAAAIVLSRSRQASLDIILPKLLAHLELHAPTDATWQWCAEMVVSLAKLGHLPPSVLPESMRRSVIVLPVLAGHTLPATPDGRAEMPAVDGIPNALAEALAGALARDAAGARPALPALVSEPAGDVTRITSDDAGDGTFAGELPTE